MSGSGNEHRFDRLADEYVTPRRAVPGTRLYLDHLYRAVVAGLGPMRAGAEVLEPFCGQGDIGGMLESMGLVVVGLDISHQMLRYNHCPFRVQGDSTALPFAAGAFDGVVVTGGLHHLTHPTLPACLREIRRVLRPGGRLAFFEPSDDFWLARLIRRFFYNRLPGLGDRDNEEIVFFRPQLSDSLRQAGFDDVRLRPFGGVAYGLLSQVDTATFLQPIAAHEWLARWLVAWDTIVEATPFVRRAAFGVVGSARA